MRIVHVTPHAAANGGMQTLVRWHRKHDGEHGLEPSVVSIFENAVVGRSDAGIGANWAWTLRRIRSAAHVEIHPLTRDAVCVYHNAWGMTHLGDGDGASRRIAYLHTDWPGLRDAAPAIAQWSDGVLSVSDDLISGMMETVPDYPRDRVFSLCTPVQRPQSPEERRRADTGRSGPVRVGLVGRLDREQKRVDRLPAMVAAVARECGAPVEWIVVGDGPDRPMLERKLSGSRVSFPGWLRGDAYWSALMDLDYVVFLSDFEGTPLALLEAMSVGAVPVFPEIGGGAERHARSVHPQCVYPRGDVAAAANRLAALIRSGDTSLRDKARVAVSAHTSERYAQDYFSAIDAVARLPRISPAGRKRAPRFSDWLPMAVVGRLCPNEVWR